MLRGKDFYLSRIPLSSSKVGTLSSAYRLIVGRIRFIFFQLRKTSFNSRNNLTALSQLFTVPAVISPLSILSLSCDRRERIFFSAPEGFFLANCKKPSGDRLTLFKNPSNFLSYGSRVAGLLITTKITQSFPLEVKIYQFFRLSISSSNINAEYSYKFFGFGSKTMRVRWSSRQIYSIFPPDKVSNI